MSKISYTWQGRLVRSKGDEYNENSGTLYIDNHFKKQGKTESQKLQHAIDTIISEIESNSGLTTPDVKIELGMKISIYSLITIILGFFFTIFDEVAINLIVIGSLGLLIGILILNNCNKNPYGEKSSIKQVKKFLEENRPSWNLLLKEFDYSLSWKLSEKTVTFERKICCKFKKIHHKCPKVSIVFDLVENLEIDDVDISMVKNDLSNERILITLDDEENKSKSSKNSDNKENRDNEGKSSEQNNTLTIRKISNLRKASRLESFISLNRSMNRSFNSPMNSPKHTYERETIERKNNF